mgnify:FL=1
MTDDSDVAITRDEVVALARGLFGEADLPSILTQLDTYGVESHETEVHRVQKAILELSDGKKTRLPYFVKCAKIDHRDVLTGPKLPPMSADEDARWQAEAERMLALWNAT